ncbi:MAG: sodium:proton antiporter [Coriobacteriaceae bacterium]|nr:sodium:proton antiporter [Coriobacteriaceae bacterium]
MWASVVTHRRWMLLLFTVSVIAAIAFEVLWMTGFLHPVTGIANTAGFAICALGLTARLIATRDSQQ